MAVGNSLAAKQQKPAEQKAEFVVAGEKVVLTPQTVKNYLISGDKDRVSMQEVVMFINLCKYAGLNPWLKEAYCIKYGNHGGRQGSVYEACGENSGIRRI